MTEAHTPSMPSLSMPSNTRREFMLSTGALVVGASAPWLAGSAQAQVGSPTKPALTADELDSWVAIAPDGRVTAFSGKVDLGQGLEVGLAQIVAEELDVAYAKVSVLMGNNANSMNQGGASNQSGIQAGGKALRNAAAEARRLLVEAASAKLSVAVPRLTVSDGVISSLDNPAQRVTYADLIGGKFFNSKVEWNQKVGNLMEIKGKATPKAPADYKVVGKPLPRTDVAWKVFGTDGHMNDVKVPGMLHARVIRSPLAGCVAEKVDAASIAAIKGARVVHEKNFLAVVAEKEWDAVRAAKQLKVQWSASKDPLPSSKTVYDFIKAAPTVKREDEAKIGDVAAAFAGAAKVIEAEYRWPFQSHASMGPACAIVDAKADSATVWTGSQKPHFAALGVASLLGLPKDKVNSIWVIGPGSYGRNDAGDAVMDAAMLSKLTGKPVRVQNMRHDATAWDPKAPASVHRARAALDASGKVVGYEFISRGFSRLAIDSKEADPRESLVGLEMGLKFEPGVVAFGVPAESYGFDNKLLGWEAVPDLIAGASPLRTSHMRDPAGLQVHFASEQFIDELAHGTGEDAMAFRLKYLKAPRDHAVLKAAAAKAGWQTRPSGTGDKSGALLKGRGMAYAQRAGTVVAVIAEIEVERKTGRIWGRKFTVAHDCGLIVNPETLRYTIEAALVQALSRSLFEEVQFEPSKVNSVDWLSYPILNLTDAPEAIDVVLINRPEVLSTGGGEATCRVVPAAIANAFFDATGMRLRQAPMTPERVLAALAKA